MVALDLSNLSNPALEKAIAFYCAQYGSVANVRIVPLGKHRQFAIAIVDMTNEVESEKVASSIGDIKIGTGAVIRLVQKDRPSPFFTTAESLDINVPA
jgi:hypothetical protein